MKGNFYTLGFAAVLGAVCALLLTVTASFTQPYQDANKEAEERLNILKALNVPLAPGVTAGQLVEIFNANVQTQIQAGEELYLYSPPQSGGTVEAVAVRFSGPGLWGPIKGFLALESDRRTIRGITFYEQEETPGLGGEIVSAGFRQQFVGKKIVAQDSSAGVVIRVGGSSLSNGVDAITGATMTCDKVQAMLNDVIKLIVEESN
ncbi:FMN-binding protein [Planctomycetota bacterium]